MDKLQEKIKELKAQSAPISYRSLSVDASGKLQNRESLLYKRIVEGYGNIWGSKNSHQERFHKGAWGKSILENGPGSGAAYEIKFRDEHGRACALFEELREDETGLYFRTKPLDDVSWADDLLTQLKSRTINNFSNGFKHIFERDALKWNEQDDCLDIFQGRLFEISATAIPSDLLTFAKRSVEELDNLYDLTEDFINSLPRKNQLEARKIFAQHKSLLNVEPLEHRKIALEINEPTESGFDFNYLITHLKEKK